MKVTGLVILATAAAQCRNAPTLRLALARPRSPIPQQLTFTPHHATGIYDVGWTVTPGPATPTDVYFEYREQGYRIDPFDGPTSTERRML